MNNYRLLPILLILCFKVATAQKIQYSKSILRTPGAGNIQLVANVNGYHHLIYFSVGKKPIVHVFNAQLQLRAREELNIKLSENVDISILKLNNYYVLYAHTLDPSQHQLIKINGDGTSSDLSSLLQQPADSLWNRSKASFQLFSQNNQIFLVSHFYQEPIKQIKSSIVQLDPAHPKQLVFQFLFPFDHNNDELKHVSINNNHLFVLKTTRDDEDNYNLTVVKVHLLTGVAISKQFESGRYAAYSPAIRFNPADSSIFLYSILYGPPGYKGSGPGIFMASLDNALNERVPIRAITNAFRGNTLSSFYVEKNKTTGWMNFSAMRYSGPKGNRLYDSHLIPPPFSSTSPFPVYDVNNIPTTRVDVPIAVRMVVLNERLQNNQDSVVKNNGKYFNLHPWSHAQFVLQNKAYLLMVHELAAKRKGLVLMYPTEQGKIESLPVRVYHQFNFLLTLVQSAEDYFLVPFTNKKEMGLMKVTLNR